MPRWKLNLIVLCVAQLLTQMGFSAYLPSTAYFVQELAGVGPAETARWVAALNSVDAFAMMAVAPLWGALADRFGRKLMVGRATLAGALLILPMALVTDPGQLLALRAAQGVFCGTVAAVMTLVATQTPDEHLGLALGAMQMAQFVGRAIGPLGGGLVADLWGYRAVYPASSGAMAIAFLGIALLVRERFVRAPYGRAHQLRAPAAARPRTPLWRSAALRALLSGNLLSLYLAMWAISFATTLIGAMLPLYVQALQPDASNLATLAGATMSVTALTSSLAALGIGRLGDRVGQKPVLIACALGVAGLCIPQALVATPLQLLALRTLEGVFVGGMMPTANALLARSTPASRRGTVFGLSASISSAGRAMGPLAGAGVANTWGLGSTFLATAGVYAITAGVVGALMRPRADVTEPTGEEAPKGGVEEEPHAAD